jgi:uncharacterized cupin superfamily protein
VGIAHWDDVESEDLGGAAGSLNVSVRRVRMAPGHISTPWRVDPLGEEIIFVLEGSGLSRQDDKAYKIRAGDCIVHGATSEAHALRAGDEGLTVLAYGIHTRTLSSEPEVDWRDPGPRPPNIRNLDEAEVGYEGERGRWIRFAVQAGAVRSGLNWGRLEPGHAGARPHCHSAEEEIFVILEGGGVLDLWPSPARAADNPREQYEVRAGHVIARPPGTGISHSFTAGDEGMTFLLYGTREPNDICYYPRSNKIYWRGVGLIGRLEPLDYDDGEPEE